MNLKNRSRILAFRLGGDAVLPQPDPVAAAAIPEPPASNADAEQLAMGKDLYYERCAACHGIDVASGGVIPDLRHASAETHAKWDAIVLGGLLRDNGMPAFGAIFSKVDSDAVHAFVIERSRIAYERQGGAGESAGE